MESKSVIRIFDNPQFGQVRVAVIENNEPMFCLADVCKALDLKNPSQVKTRLKGNGLQTIDNQALYNNDGVSISKLGNTVATYINEANLYKCIFQSRKPEAEKFQDWVTSEVLPSIRKTGGYIATKEDDTPEMIMARAILVANETIERQKQRIAEQNARMESNAPKVLFAESLRAADRSILIGELAKILKQNGYDTGQKRLFQYLRDNGYLMKSGSSKNQPTQKSMDSGLFEMTTRTIAGADGLTIAKVTTKVTVKGQEYFINKLIPKNND